MMYSEQRKQLQTPSPDEALAIAESIFRSRYEGASFAYVAGSIMRGQGTYLSDIDLVVIYDQLEAARREHSQPKAYRSRCSSTTLRHWHGSSTRTYRGGNQVYST